MKVKNIITLHIIIVSVLCLSSCDRDIEEQTDTGMVEFNLNIISTPSLKSSLVTGDPDSIIISIKDILGVPILTFEKIELISFGDEYITAPIPLPPGQYYVTEFLVADDAGEIIYAAPIENSPLEGAVSDALPISFSVLLNNTTTLSPNVLTVGLSSPGQFGYSSFSFDVIETFQFQLGVFVLDNNLDPVFVQNASLIITANSQTIYNGIVGNSTNIITTVEGFTDYILTIYKSGYILYQETFTNSDLKEYLAPDNLPLVVTLIKAGELLFWNTLDSQIDIENSLVGPDGIFYAGDFVDGIFDQAYRADYMQDTMVVFPIGPANIDPFQGCIEFWVRFIDPSYTIYNGNSGCYDLFNITNTTVNMMSISVNGNNGLGTGGLTGYVKSEYPTYFNTCGTFSYTNNFSLSSLLGNGLEETWHHYALVWNSNGIIGVSDGTKKVCAFLDGQLNSAFWNAGTISDYNPAAIQFLTLKLINNRFSQGYIAFDNIKIWDYQKTDFYDRFIE